MILSGILRLAAGTISSILAFLVALLPERIKEQSPFSRFQSNTAHFFSGISECAFSLALFIYGYDYFVGGIIRGQSHALAEKVSQAPISEGLMGGMGILGFVLYLINPVALFSLFLSVEGIVRAFAAVLTGHRHGIAVFWAIDRIVLFARRKRSEAIHRRQLGPGQREFLRKDKSSGSLVFISTRDKEWHKNQTAQCGEGFYILSSQTFVQRGRYYRYQYTFRPMLPGEIIRGKIAVLPSIASKK